MNIHAFAITLISTFAFGAGCGSSAINGAASTTEDLASGSGAGGGSVLPSRSCSPANTSRAPADGLIADFKDAGGGIEISGGIVTYAAPKVAGLGSANYTTTGGALNITVNAALVSKPQFLGVVVAFDKCIDASAFTGVQFTISGSFSGCTLQYATSDVEHQDMTWRSGPAGAYPPHDRIAVDEMTATPRTIKAPFAVTDVQGSPAPSLDPTKLISTQWQFTVPVAAEGETDNPMCTASVTIDNVKFYR